MANPFTVTLLEGGKALVMEGDPAYYLCQQIRLAGYTQIVLPAATVITGVPQEAEMTEELDTLAYAMEAEAIQEVHECAHHWVLGDPVDGKYPSHCRYCSATKDHKYAKLEPEYTFKDWDKKLRTLASARNTKAGRAMHEDWAARMGEALLSAGLKGHHTSDINYRIFNGLGQQITDGEDE